MKTLFLLILINISLFSQPKTINYSNWLFGFKAGITFNTSNNEAIEINDNIYALNTSEGISTISDDKGKLILSCNGIHLVHFIKGKSGLNYEIFDITKFKQFESSTNSNIILPSLENKNQYYIFYAGDIADYNKLVYRIFDVSLNNGKGSWVGDFVPIYDDFISEKVTAIYDYNNKFYWIVTTEKDNDNYANILLYKLDENGLNTIPKKVKMPFKTDQYGDIKFSPDGQYLAVCQSINNTLLVYKFNFQLGGLDKILQITNKETQVLSVEFSPKLNYIYTIEKDLSTKKHSIYQYDFSSQENNKFTNSRLELKISNSKFEYLHLENAPNGKIYATTYDYSRVPFNYDFNFLTIIENPDEKSDFLNYNILNFTGGRHPNIGLITKPTIINENYTKCVPKVEIFLENKTLNLGEDFCINGNFKPVCDDSTYLRDITLSFQYDPNLMKFKSCSNDYNIENQFDKNKISLTFPSNDIKLDMRNDFSICFSSLLGESVFTSINILDDNQEMILTDTINSQIEYISCDQEFRLIKLITATEFEAILVSRNLRINLTTSEEGNFEFLMVDISGNVVKEKNYKTTKDKYSKEEIFQFDLNDLSSGIYNIRMTSPSGKYYTKRIILVD